MNTTERQTQLRDAAQKVADALNNLTAIGVNQPMLQITSDFNGCVRFVDGQVIPDEEWIKTA